MAWIISTTAQPSKANRDAVLTFYTQMYSTTQPVVPKDFPPASIVGLVSFTKALSAEEYRAEVSGGIRGPQVCCVGSSCPPLCVPQVLDATSPLENHQPWLMLCEDPLMLEQPLRLTAEDIEEIQRNSNVLPSSLADAAQTALVPPDLSWRPALSLVGSE